MNRTGGLDWWTGLVDSYIIRYICVIFVVIVCNVIAIYSNCLTQ